MESSRQLPVARGNSMQSRACSRIRLDARPGVRLLGCSSEARSAGERPRLARPAWSVLLLVCLAAAAARPAVAREAEEGEGRRTYEFALVGIPLSPLHSVVAIGQELCLRGHNVTVLSFDERGRKKTQKYSPVCQLRYFSLGPLPVSDEEQQSIMARMENLTNDTFASMQAAASNLFAPYFSALRAPVEAALAAGAVRPDFALVSLPAGAVGLALERYGVDFAINMPTILVPPLVPYAAAYVPIPFLFHGSLHDMTLPQRVAVICGNVALHVLRHVAAALGFEFSALPDLNPATWMGRLVLINSIPGFDYPQALPPLVQYIGPVLDLGKMESFEADTAAWLEAVPEGTPVVYVSFGTVAHLSPPRVAAMVNTLTSDRYHVLWALPKEQQRGLPEELPPSMKVHHWVPTPRALAHPKVVAFVSHCGGNSAAESMAMGVPIVGYPQFGDQPAVCRRIADAGAGTTRPAGCWVQASDVLEVVTNKSYAAKARSLGRLFRHFGGVGKAADLLELGARGDLEAMRLPTERSWPAFFQLGGYEALAVALLAAHAAAFLGAACCRRICRCFCCCCSRPRGLGTARGKEKEQ